MDRGERTGYEMTFFRGTVVYATDPFKSGDAGRPWVIVNTPDMPFHGEQYVVLTLSTKTWYDDRLPIADGDLPEGGLPKDSSILPWAIATVDHGDVDRKLGRVDESVVDEAVWALVGYLGIQSANDR